MFKQETDISISVKRTFINTPKVNAQTDLGEKTDSKPNLGIAFSAELGHNLIENH
jgi:hypothetical protein